MNETNISVDKTPYELLDEAGYQLFECTTEEEIQSFKNIMLRMRSYAHLMVEG